MAYVTPNSVLQLFKNINLDNRYLHTIYFASESAQDTWFSARVFKSYNDLMYRRYTSESIRIEADATTLLGVSYMRFKNTRSANKWFYAFVNYVDYVNENTAVIYYEVDVMQTWFIQGGSINPCMVLREHVNDDTFKNNLEAEPVGSDVYDMDYLTNFSEFGDYSIVAQTTGTSGTDTHVKHGLFTGCNYYSHACNNQGDGNTIYADIGNMLGSWSQQTQEEDLVDLYTVPTFTLTELRPISPQDEITRPTTYDQYTPKNNKLFMYPFSYLLLSTHCGDTAFYRWEYFDSNNIEFLARGTYIGGGEVECYPSVYNGIQDNVDSGLTITNFPKNAFAYDAYQAWIASGGSTRLENERVVTSFKGASSVMSTLGSLIGQTTTTPSTSTRETIYNHVGTVGNTMVTNQARQASITEYTKGLSLGGVTGAVSNAVGTVGSLIEARNNLQYVFNDAVYTPNIVVGKPSAKLPFAVRNANFYFYHCHVRDSEAVRIDDFFSCYGYAINQVKAPNLTGRRYFNFVQTQDAVISGEMPSSSKEAIGRIFDSGITFWHDGEQIGNYRQSVSDGSINNPII